MSGQQFGSEDVFTEIPNQSSSVEGVLNLEPDPFMKRLPHRHNRAIPNSVHEALADPRWKAAMNEEMKSLQKNETWELVNVTRKEASWVSLDYTVKYKADAKINTIRVLLSLAANLDWPLQQFDVKNAFLHGELSEEAHTRPDLAYALSVVSQYMHNPGEQHMNVVMRILRYLKNAPGKGILFTKNVNHQSIEVYTDADWVGAVDDRRSTSGYFTFVGGNLVTWKSKKQNVVARSSAKAEFRAACDIAHNPVQHDRTKHVEVDRFFIKEKLDDKIVELPKIRSEDQLVDILTKAVSKEHWKKVRWGLVPCFPMITRLRTSLLIASRKDYPPRDCMIQIDRKNEAIFLPIYGIQRRSLKPSNPTDPDQYSYEDQNGVPLSRIFTVTGSSELYYMTSLNPYP
ncbi:Retrovirus-related Pol polyprotein from transposon RE1 [Vitis vinifera]|uniref:Retrovirus-related Pol polyprotein from transposon RE1 n=1 Tax=Vitis vinifera TaxID=29760 RepID=A0A438J450_VITVI|nr:Retrovirus-related Pol polyprotein from transposon RE1 [Vitis vinifera]